MDVQAALRKIWQGEKRHAVVIVSPETDPVEEAKQLAAKGNGDVVSFPADLSHAQSENFILSSILRECIPEKCGSPSAQRQLLEIFNTPSPESPAYRLILSGLDTAPRTAVPSLRAELAELSASRGMQLVILSAYDLPFLETSFAIDGTQFSSIRPSQLEPRAAESRAESLHNKLRDVNSELDRAEKTVVRLKQAMTEVTRGMQTPEQQKKRQGMIDFVLTPGNNMTLAELDEAAKMLRARLDVLTEAEYPFSVEKNNKIHIQLPADAFYGVSPALVMTSLIASPMALYLINNEPSVYRIIPVNRKDLALVRRKQGSIEIKLTQDFVTCNAEKLSGWNAPVFALDFPASCRRILSTYPDADRKTFRVLDESIRSETFAETMVYALTHPPLPGAFTVSYTTPIEWKIPADAHGKLQTTPEEIKEPSVTIQYGSNATDTGSNDYLVTIAALIARLDAIGQPYALGEQYVNGQTNVLVKTGLTRIAPYMLHFGNILVTQQIKASDFLVAHSAENYGHACGGEDLSFISDVSTNGTGDAALCVSVSTSKDKDLLPLAEYAESVCTAEEPRMCLFFGGLPLLTVEKEDISGNTVTFRHIYGYGKEQEDLGEHGQWIFRLANTLIKTSIPLTLKPKGAYAPNAQEAVALSRTINPWSKDEKSVAAAIRAAAPGVSVSFPNAAGKIQIVLNLNVDEDLPSTALRQIEAIYKASGFPHSRFGEELFVLVTEKEKDFERARVLFTKRDGGIRISYRFGNGRLDKYKAQFEKLLQTNNFFAGSIRVNG